MTVESRPFVATSTAVDHVLAGERMADCTLHAIDKGIASPDALFTASIACLKTHGEQGLAGMLRTVQKKRLERL